MPGQSIKKTNLVDLVDVGDWYSIFVQSHMPHPDTLCFPLNYKANSLVDLSHLVHLSSLKEYKAKQPGSSKLNRRLTSDSYSHLLKLVHRDLNSFESVFLTNQIRRRNRTSLLDTPFSIKKPYEMDFNYSWVCYAYFNNTN